MKVLVVFMSFLSAAACVGSGIASIFFFGSGDNLTGALFAVSAAVWFPSAFLWSQLLRDW